MMPVVPAGADLGANHSTCESCGREVFVGDFPFCPHGRPLYYQQPFKATVDDNLGSYLRQKDGSLRWVPAEVTSQAQRKALMRERKLDYYGRRMGEPGVEF